MMLAQRPNALKQRMQFKELPDDAVLHILRMMDSSDDSSTR